MKNSIDEATHEEWESVAREAQRRNALARIGRLAIEEHDRTEEYIDCDEGEYSERERHLFYRMSAAQAKVRIAIEEYLAVFFPNTPHS